MAGDIVEWADDPRSRDWLRWASGYRAQGLRHIDLGAVDPNNEDVLQVGILIGCACDLHVPVLFAAGWGVSRDERLVREHALRIVWHA